MRATLNPKSAVADLEEARLLIARVADSDRFLKSPRLREFLLYVGRCTLEDRLQEVREQVIAERVFSRRPEAGGQDSIVRAEARNLRKRLEAYFSNEGRHEHTVIVMPKGGYSLAFVSRSDASSFGAPEEVPVELEAGKSGSILPVSEIRLPEAEIRARYTTSLQRPYRTAILVLVPLTLLFAGLALFWYLQTATLRSQLGIAPVTFPMSALFNEQQSSMIVTSDTGLLQISSLVNRRISLDEYVSRSYPSMPATNPPNLLQNWNIYEFTDGREMAIATLLLSRNAQFANHISVHSGHAVQLQDFKDHNVILIGSPISNPWAELYEDKLNFRCALAPDGRIVYRNRRQRKNETAQFPCDDDIQRHHTYARLAFFPRTVDAPAALLIAGTTAQATQSAGELMVDQARLSRTLQSMGIDPMGRPRFFEFLIRLDNFVGGAILPEVEAWRLSPAPEH